MFCMTFAKAQNNLNDYKYIVVPHFYEFIQGKDTYRLNTITRFLFKKRGFNAFMAEEIKEADYLTNNCLALNADVVNLGGFTRTKLMIVLTNCDNEVVFSSDEGISKLKEYEKAYKEALNKAFVSFDSIVYNYTPNKGVTSRATNENKGDEVAQLREEIKELKAEKEKIKEKKPESKVKQVKNGPKEKQKEAKEPKAIEKKEKDMTNLWMINGSYYAMQSASNGFKFVDEENDKEDIVFTKTSRDNMFIVMKGDMNGLGYFDKKTKIYTIEYTDSEGAIAKFLIKKAQ